MTPDPGWSGYLLVAAGGALGAVLRHLAGEAWDRRQLLPVGTIGVNLAGSAMLGLLTGASVGAAAAALVGLGFCGALTTWSTFAVQSHDRGLRWGTLTVLLTLAPAVAAYGAGAALGGALLPG